VSVGHLEESGSFRVCPADPHPRSELRLDREKRRALFQDGRESREGTVSSMEGTPSAIGHAANERASDDQQYARGGFWNQLERDGINEWSGERILESRAPHDSGRSRGGEPDE
jgi:hypothetical protein